MSRMEKIEQKVVRNYFHSYSSLIHWLEKLLNSELFLSFIHFFFLFTNFTANLLNKCLSKLNTSFFFFFLYRDLRYNHIREIPSEAFSGLKHLHTIFLNENQVTTIHGGAFHGLPSLKYLYLNKNRLTNVSEDAFSQLDHLQSL